MTPSLKRARLDARAAALEFRLRQDPPWVSAMFDGSWAALLWLIAVFSILAIELSANIGMARDWSYVVHAAIMFPLELAVLLGLLVGTRRRLWRFRLRRAQRTLHLLTAPHDRRSPLAST